MKLSIYKYLFIIFILISQGVFAQIFNMDKSYDRSFHLNKDMEVSIINKYGDIQVVHWDNDSVRIQIKVHVTSHKEHKAQKLFEAIDIKFKNNFFYVVAETEMLGKSSVWTDISDATKQLFNSKTTSRIDYTVHLPRTSQLIIKNKYGNVYLGDYEGELDIEVSNGDIKAHDLLGKTKLNVSFGDLFINKIKHAIIQTVSAEAEIEEIVYLETHTRSSKFFIEHIDELVINSSHDKYHIGELNQIRGKGNFTFLKIKELINQVDIAQKYGALHFRNIGQDVRKFNLNTYKSDIHLSLNYERSYLLDFTTANPPQIQYPTGEYKKSEVVINEDDDIKNIQITWGNEDSNTILPIHIKAEEGNVFINVK